MLTRLLLACSAVIAVARAVPVQAVFTEVALTGGRSAQLKNKEPGKQAAKVVFTDEPALPLVNPTCPGGAASWVRLTSSRKGSGELQDTGVVHLPCAKWEARGGGAYVFRDKENAHGIRQIVYKVKDGLGRLQIKWNGSKFVPHSGPVNWIEARLTIGSTSMCGRFDYLRKNTVPFVAAAPFSRACESSCGNGALDILEECDDGNRADGDCCSAFCSLDPVGTPCDDGQFCTTNDSCDNGNCAGMHYLPAECNDRNICTDDGCDERLSGGVGACTHTLNTRPCSDGNSCTVGDRCAGGECLPGEFTEPWINEIDYDDQSDGNNDRDEFIEIAGPSGKDISNYWLVSVEGGGSGCNTPWLYDIGVVHWTIQIPAGTILKGGTCNGGASDGQRCAGAEDCPEGVCDDPSRVGYYVACFGDNSTHVLRCDGQFDQWWWDSTFHNGHVYNTDDTCPDGVVLADRSFQPGNPSGAQSIGSVVDAVSYEGVVPNAGAGVLFYAPQLVTGDPGSYVPYDAGTDEGGGYCGGFLGLSIVDAPGVSLEKRTDNPSRATSADEWFDSGNCDDVAQIGHTGGPWCWLGACECVPDPDCETDSATPGGPNAGQEEMSCVAAAVCGDGMIDPPEDCDTGAANPEESCGATEICADDCVCRAPAVCGNGTIDWGEACDTAHGNADCGQNERCNSSCQCEPIYCGNGQLDPDQGEECDLSAGVDCVAPEICTECVCKVPALGPLTFNIADGPGDVCPAPNATGSWTKTHGGPEGGMAGGPPVCNGTLGGWAGAIKLIAGPPNADGVAELTIDGVNVYGANMNPNACQLFGSPPCRLCFRLRQDPVNTGYIDCNGGTNVDVTQEVTSNEANPPPPPDPGTVIGGGADSGPGAAVIFGLMKNGMFKSDPCPAWNSSAWDSLEEAPVVFTTGKGRSVIHDPRVCAGGFGSNCPNVDPYEVTLTGQNFECENWTGSGSGVLVMPASVLDMTISVLGTGDLAQVTRLCRSTSCQEPVP